MPLHQDGRVFPLRIDIGTKAAFKKNRHYPYEFNFTMGCYVCEKTTENGRSNEVIVLDEFHMTDGMFFVAMEGAAIDGAFVARQMVFRTQAEFWKDGTHEWQVNSSSCGEAPPIPDPVWDLVSQLPAQTKVPGDDVEEEDDVWDIVPVDQEDNVVDSMLSPES
jgi:hypothetical protein